jgi:hypothetical protein
MKLKIILLNIFPNVLADIIINYYKYHVNLKLNKLIDSHFYFNLENYLGHINNLVFIINTEKYSKKILICYNLLTNKYESIHINLVNIFIKEQIDRFHCYANHIYIYTLENKIYKLDMMYNIIMCHKLKIRINIYNTFHFSKNYFIWCGDSDEIVKIYDMNINEIVREFKILKNCDGFRIKNIQIYKTNIFTQDYCFRGSCDSFVLRSLKKPYRKYTIIEAVYNICFQIINDMLYLIDDQHELTSYKLGKSKKCHNIKINYGPQCIIKVDNKLFILCCDCKIYVLDIY